MAATYIGARRFLDNKATVPQVTAWRKGHGHHLEPDGLDNRPRSELERCNDNERRRRELLERRAIKDGDGWKNIASHHGDLGDGCSCFGQ